MSSRIATALLALPRTQSESSDMIWRNADLAVANSALVIPSDKLVRELVLITDGDIARKFGSILPTSHAIAIALSLKSSAPLRDGLVRNPFITLDQLKQIAGKSGKSAEAARERLATGKLSETPRYADLQQHLATGGQIDAIIELGEYAVHEWFSLLSTEDTLLADQLLVTSVVRKVRLNVLMADRLVSRATEALDTAVALLDTPRDANRIGTPSALRLLEQSGTISTPPSRPSKGSMSATTIQGLRLAGASDFELTPLVLSNDSADLASYLVLDLMVKAPTSLLTQFLSGASARQPRPGQALELLRRISSDKVAALSSTMSDAVEVVPWVAELLIGLPVRSLENVGLGGLHALNLALTERLPDAAAWEMVLVMSEEWEQSLDTLLEAARSMTVLA